MVIGSDHKEVFNGGGSCLLFSLGLHACQGRVFGMEEFHDENDGGNPQVTRQDLHDLIEAINASRTQMDGQLKALKEEMLRPG